MPLPPVQHCIICEETRPEGHGKIFILGFYGVAPDVLITLQGLEQQQRSRLSFMFLTKAVEAKCTLGLKLLDDEGNQVVDTTTGSLEITKPSKDIPVQIVVQLDGLRFPKFGEYSVVLMADGSEHYRTTFRVGPVNPGPPPAA